MSMLLSLYLIHNYCKRVRTWVNLHSFKSYIFSFKFYIFYRLNCACFQFLNLWYIRFTNMGSLIEVCKFQKSNSPFVVPKLLNKKVYASPSRWLFREFPGSLNKSSTFVQPVSLQIQTGKFHLPAPNSFSAIFFCLITPKEIFPPYYKLLFIKEAAKFIEMF